MDKKIELIKNLAEANACLLEIEESELKHIERAVDDIRRICNAGYILMEEVYEQLDLK